MKPLLFVLSGIALAALFKWSLGQVWSFRAQSPLDYEGQTPAIDIRQNLAGPMVAEGVIYDFTGRVTSRFTGEMVGIWEADRGTLREVFTYSSGTLQRREWALEVSAAGEITGTAADIVGQATGQQVGPVVQLNYRLRLPENAGGHLIDVTDWMYLTGTGAIMNRAEFRKFGLKVGEMIATFRPLR